MRGSHPRHFRLPLDGCRYHVRYRRTCSHTSRLKTQRLRSERRASWSNLLAASLRDASPGHPRCLSQQGFIPYAHLLGQAVLVVESPGLLQQIKQNVRRPLFQFAGKFADLRQRYKIEQCMKGKWRSVTVECVGQRADISASMCRETVGHTLAPCMFGTT